MKNGVWSLQGVSYVLDFEDNGLVYRKVCVRKRSWNIEFLTMVVNRGEKNKRLRWRNVTFFFFIEMKKKKKRGERKIQKANINVQNACMKRSGCSLPLLWCFWTEGCCSGRQSASLWRQNTLAVPPSFHIITLFSFNTDVSSRAGSGFQSVCLAFFFFPAL